MTPDERDLLLEGHDVDDWRWQLRNAITTFDAADHALASFTNLRFPASAVTQEIATSAFNFKVTPFMLAALKRGLELQLAGTWNAFCASFVPSAFEGERLGDDLAPLDSIGEDLARSHPAPAVTQFYRNRALLRVSQMCPAYCRYCFRRRLVGDSHAGWNRIDIDAAFAFIASDTSINEVILSGGEPFVLGDDRIAYVLNSLARISHVRRVRIDTKALTMLPQRFTPELCNLLRSSKLSAVVGHFSHLYELTPEVARAIGRLVDVGIPVYAHIPLLRNINDDETALRELVERLLDLRVRPYYLIQFISTQWTEHFRVSIARGMELMAYLQQHCTGMAVPTYIVYLPSGHGKVPVSPSYLIGHTTDGYVFRAHDGATVLYREPTIDGQEAAPGARS